MTITKEELVKRIDQMQKTCISAYSNSEHQKKAFNIIVRILKDATKKQLLAYEPSTFVPCTLQILHYFNENLSFSENTCKWKRQRKQRLARRCYHSLLRIYIPEKSDKLVKAVLSVIFKQKFWECESFCLEIICNLLENGANAAIMLHAVWDKIETASLSVEDSRVIIRIVYKMLEICIWPDNHDTVVVLERLLNLFYLSITNEELSKTSHPHEMLKKGLEVCIKNIVKNLSNNHLLIVIQHMCSWAVEEGMKDNIIFYFGSILEYTAYAHQVTLYKKTLTPKIFPLLVQMIESKNKIISLLGNRVLQYLLDRNGNKFMFDTPKLFFENTRVNIKIAMCLKEDILFCKTHRETLHDCLLKSIINHSNSRMNLETTYCTICLIAVEVPCGFTAAALVCFVINLQDLALKITKYHMKAAYHVHASIIAIMSLLCWIHKAKVFYAYVNKIMMKRAQFAPHLNPPIQSQYSFAVHHILWHKPDLFFVDWETRYGLWKCFRLRNEQNS